MEVGVGLLPFSPRSGMAEDGGEHLWFSNLKTTGVRILKILDTPSQEGCWGL